MNAETLKCLGKFYKDYADVVDENRDHTLEFDTGKLGHRRYSPERSS